MASASKETTELSLNVAAPVCSSYSEYAEYLNKDTSGDTFDYQLLVKSLDLAFGYSAENAKKNMPDMLYLLYLLSTAIKKRKSDKSQKKKDAELSLEIRGVKLMEDPKESTDVSARRLDFYLKYRILGALTSSDMDTFDMDAVTEQAEEVKDHLLLQMAAAYGITTEVLREAEAEALVHLFLFAIIIGPSMVLLMYIPAVIPYALAVEKFQELNIEALKLKNPDGTAQKPDDLFYSVCKTYTEAAMKDQSTWDTAGLLGKYLENIKPMQGARKKMVSPAKTLRAKGIANARKSTKPAEKSKGKADSDAEELKKLKEQVAQSEKKDKKKNKN